MAQNKTHATAASVDEHLAARARPEQLPDCQALMAICQRATGQPARMWGPSIVGFGAYRYSNASGHSGEAPLAGFAVRGRELVVYLGCDDDAQAQLLGRLGKHKMGKSCLYIKRLADVNRQVLEQLVVLAVAEVRRRHPGKSDA